MPAESGLFIEKIVKFILGKKLGMSQVYGEDGNVTPVTVVEAEPNTVLQVKNMEKDKYEAVQVGFGTKKEKNINKQQKGHFKDMGNFATVKEFRFDSKGKRSRGQDQEDISSAQLTVGQKIDVSVFVPGDAVKVTGMTKGKGFQGVVKRHGFHGAWASHGPPSGLAPPGFFGQEFPPPQLKGLERPS